MWSFAEAGQRRHSCPMGGKKRPCSICRRWFLPDPRVGNRQTTCSCPACQEARRVRTQHRWRKKNPSYQADYRLRQQAEKLESGEGSSVEMRGPPAEMSGVPWTFAKDAMGAQGVVFMAYLLRLFIGSGKDETRSKHFVIAGESGGHPLGGAKDQTDRRSVDCEAFP